MVENESLFRKQTKRWTWFYVAALAVLIAACGFAVWHDDEWFHEQQKTNDRFAAKMQLVRARLDWQQRAIDFYRSGMTLQEQCLIQKPMPVECFARFDAWNRVGQKLWQDERELWPSDPNLLRVEPIVVIPPADGRSH